MLKNNLRTVSYSYLTEERQKYETKNQMDGQTHRETEIQKDYFQAGVATQHLFEVSHIT
jgi:hypothetical protein